MGFGRLVTNMSASHRLDEHADLHSPIHHWDARFKLVGLLFIIFAFATVDSIWLLIPMLIITLLLYSMTKLPWSFLRHRLEFPGFFILFLVIFLPFVSGDTILLSFGPFDIRQEGIEQAAVVAVRFFCILTLAIVLFGTDSFINTIKALRALRFPDILADMVLLTYRYLFEMTTYFQTMRTAARMRGFRAEFSLASMNTLTSLLGHMIVRSYEQSERVYKAMVLRGYGATKAMTNDYHATQNDTLKLVAAIGVALLFWIAQYIVNS